MRINIEIPDWLDFNIKSIPEDGSILATFSYTDHTSAIFKIERIIPKISIEAGFLNLELSRIVKSFEQYRNNYLKQARL